MNVKRRAQTTSALSRLSVRGWETSTVATLRHRAKSAKNKKGVCGKILTPQHQIITPQNTTNTTLHFPSLVWSPPYPTVPPL